MLRTGISLISFGITLNRFSLFLIQNDKYQDQGMHFLHETKNVGIGMVMIACCLLLWSIYHFIKTDKAIDTLSFRPVHWSLVSFTAVILICAITMTVWMIRS